MAVDGTNSILKRKILTVAVPKPAQQEVQKVDRQSVPRVPDEQPCPSLAFQKDEPAQTVTATTGDGPIPKGKTPTVVVPRPKRLSTIDRFLISQSKKQPPIPKKKFPTVVVPAPRAQSYASRVSTPSAHREARQPKHEPTRARARTPSAPPRRPDREPARMPRPNAWAREQARILIKAARAQARTLVLTEAKSQRSNELGWTQVR